MNDEKYLAAFFSLEGLDGLLPSEGLRRSVPLSLFSWESKVPPQGHPPQEIRP